MWNRKLIFCTDESNEHQYKGHIENRDRDYSMKEMHDNGLTYDAIGKCFGVSRQRAHKIVEQARRNQLYGL